MYPPEVVAPFREDLTSKGFKELTSADEVDNHLNTKEGTQLVFTGQNPIGTHL